MNEEGRAMRIGLIVDAACDLPQAFLEEKDIEILPIQIRIGDRLIHDSREPIAMKRFYREVPDRKADHFAESHPLEANELEQIVLDKWARRYDHVVCMTIAASRSQIFSSTMKAALSAGKRSRTVRSDLGLPSHWGASVLNSRSMFAGQGVLAWEAVRLRDEGVPLAEMEERLRKVADQLHAYLVADDLYYLLHRAAKKGDTSVNWGAYAVGKLFDVKPILHCHCDETGPVAKVRGFEAGFKRLLDNALREIEGNGLSVPCVCISYGGDVLRLETMPAFVGFRERVKAAGVTLLISQMSKTGAVNVGAGAACVGFASAGHRFS